MKRICQRVTNRLDSIAAWAKRVAGEMQDDAFVGRPSDTLVGALGQLERRTNLIADKLDKVVREIQATIAEMKRADNQAGAQFR